jgi:hypothetical protein
MKTIAELHDFVKHAARIRRALKTAEKAQDAAKRADHPGLRPAETPEGVLYVECYRYYRRLKRHGKLQALAEHLAQDRQSRWRRHRREGVENVLRLIERPGTAWLVTPSRRGRIVEELKFADRYDVHSKLLLAFLHEAGPHARIKLAAEAEDPKPWMLHYQRVSDFLRKQAAERRKRAEPTADGETVAKSTDS